MEKWKSVIGYEGIYEISDLGRLRRILKPRKYRPYQNKILNPCKDKNGYFRTVLTDNNKNRKSKRVNRIVAIAFIPNPDNKPCVNHKNGIKSDNRAVNLEWVTVSENNIHAIRNGLSGQAGGEDHHMSKLKEAEVLKIKKMYATKKYKQIDLAEIFRISQTQISRIINNKRWRQTTKQE